MSACSLSSRIGSVLTLVFHLSGPHHDRRASRGDLARGLHELSCRASLVPPHPPRPPRAEPAPPLQFAARTTQVYNSTAFKAVGAANQDFLASLATVVDRDVSFANMYNVYDFYNVESLHNATFLNRTNAQVWAQTRHLANYHENAIFTDPSLDGIGELLRASRSCATREGRSSLLDSGNIAGQTILPPILDALESFADPSKQLKILYLGRWLSLLLQP